MTARHASCPLCKNTKTCCVHSPFLPQCLATRPACSGYRKSTATSRWRHWALQCSGWSSLCDTAGRNTCFCPHATSPGGSITVWTSSPPCWLPWRPRLPSAGGASAVSCAAGGEERRLTEGLNGAMTNFGICRKVFPQNVFTLHFCLFQLWYGSTNEKHWSLPRQWVN